MPAFFRRNIVQAGAAVMLLGFLAGVFYFTRFSPSRKPPSPLPPLLVQGKHIVRADTMEPVLLRGALTDYFRYGRFNEYYRDDELEWELKRVKSLKGSGANIIGFYMADSKAILENLAELDAYIAFAENNGMYVYLLPVAREYDDRKAISDGSASGTYDDLKELVDLLASRYSERSNILYGLGAEPDGDDFDTWNRKQIELGGIVRARNPAAILLITSPDYGKLRLYLSDPFPLPNVVYLGGGYASADDADAQRVTWEVEDRTVLVWMGELARTYPYFAVEFGGNYGGDFSSPRDLAVIRRMLEGLNEQGHNYTMYKLSQNNPEGDPLSIYDSAGEVTIRGRVFLEALRKSPGTKFW